MPDLDPRVVEDSLVRDDIEVAPDEHKLGELLLLVAEELADDRFGGATKVNKVLFFAEFAHVRLTGRPITGAPYQKLPHGPAPRRLRPVRERLVAAGDAQLVTETALGREQHRLQPLRPARRDMFTDTELGAVLDAVALLRGRTGTEAGRLSHEDAAWQLVEEGERIPFVAAYLAPEQRRSTPRIRARAAAIAREYAQRATPGG